MSVCFQIVMLVICFCLSDVFASKRVTYHEVVEIQMMNFESTLASLRLDMGRYPTSEEGLNSLLFCPVSMNRELWDGPYLRKMPKDPWENEYQYNFDYKTNAILLFSKGVDKKSNSMGNDTDDINNWDKNKSWIVYYEKTNYLRNFIYLSILALIMTASYITKKIYKSIKIDKLINTKRKGDASLFKG